LPASHIAAYVLHRLEASPPHTISALTGLYLYHRQSWLGETNDLLAYDFGISASHVSQILMMWARVGFLRFEAFGTLPTLEEEFFMRPLNAEFAQHVVAKPDWTGLRIQKPSDRWLQRLTWNDYYGRYDPGSVLLIHFRSIELLPYHAWLSRLWLALRVPDDDRRYRRKSLSGAECLASGHCQDGGDSSGHVR
jgi:hypothetical protein